MSEQCQHGVYLPIARCPVCDEEVIASLKRDLALMTHTWEKENEIAQEDNSRQHSADIGPHERAGCSPWNCWLKDGTKCTVLEE